MPDHNYMGPGTDIATQIERHVMPVDYDDIISLYHDVDYSRATSMSDIVEADKNMLNRLDVSLGRIMPIADHNGIATTAMKLKQLTNTLANELGLDLVSTRNVINDYVLAEFDKKHNII